MKLTLDQVNSLARLLKEVEKNDISLCTYSKEIQSGVKVTVIPYVGPHIV